MPTTRPRHPVTETDRVSQVLADAARVWGDVPKSKLIQLILEDWATGGRSPSAHAEARQSLVGAIPGSSDLYDPRQDWPE